jgi:hypothetical protein
MNSSRQQKGTTWRRWIFRLAVTFSLLLFVATLMMRTRSATRSDLVRYVGCRPAHSATVAYEVASLGGRIQFAHSRTIHSDIQQIRFFTHEYEREGNWHYYGKADKYSQAIKNWWERYGFGYTDFQRSDESQDYRSWIVTLPYWLFAIMFLLPSIWVTLSTVVRTIRNRRRRRNGLCYQCGYNMCATRDRCPECGATPPPDNQPMQRTGAAV